MRSVTVQYCPCGHVDTSYDPKHVEMSDERLKKGFLDALILPTEECEDCKEELRRIHRKYAELDMELE